MASGQRGADQVGGRRAVDRFAQEARANRPEIDEVEHRRRQILPDRIAEIFDVDHQSVVEEAEPRLGRSEEHTSALQSLMRLSYAVFCLRKKKRNQNTTNQT